MDRPSSQHDEHDEETRDLQELLDAFASSCSLDEIASAYCSSKGNVHDAGEILVDLQNTRVRLNGSNASYVGANHLNEKESVEDDPKTLFVQKFQGSKQKKLTVSTGIVSNTLGKGYSLPHLSRVTYSKTDDVLKPESRPMCPSHASKNDHQDESKYTNNNDVEDFLLSMLHDGFNLDKEKTRDVLCSCGYDVKKSMEELLELSPFNSTKGKGINSGEAFTGNSLEENHCSNENCTQIYGSQRAVNESYLREQADVPLAVLEALYSNTKALKEEPRRTRLELGLNRKRVAREKMVPTSSIDTQDKATDVKASADTKDDLDRYKILREDVKNHWDMMKMYYELAFNEFTNGDIKSVTYLIDQGKHHNRAAREADEGSAREIVATRVMDKKDIFSLDLHMHSARAALDLLKQHLRSLLGISSISHLKVIIDSDAKDATKGRRRQAVIKLLEKQSITWVEEGNPGTILIEMDSIDPGNLTFT